MTYGTKSRIGIAFQNSWDAPVTEASSFIMIPVVTESIGQDTEQLISQNLRGKFAEGDSYEGKKGISGDINMEAQPVIIGHLLQGLYGAATTVAAGSGYTHYFVPPNSDHGTGRSASPPVTIYKHMGDAGSASLFYNVNISAMDFVVQAGDFLKVRAEVTGGQHQQIEVFSYAGTDGYMSGKRWTWDSASISIANTATAEIEDLTINTLEALEPIHSLSGSKWPSKIKRSGFRTSKVSGTISFENQDEYQNFLNATEQAFSASFTGDEISTGVKTELQLSGQKMRYTEFKPVVSGSGRVRVTFQGSFKYDDGSDTEFQATLTNTHTAYGTAAGGGGDPGQAAYSYWRITSVFSGTHTINFAQLHLLETDSSDAGLVNSGAIITSNIAPIVGSLDNVLRDVFDANYVQWSATYSNNPVLTIQYPVARQMRFLRWGRTSTSHAFMRGFKISYSDDGSTYTDYRTYSHASIYPWAGVQGISNQYQPVIHFSTDYADVGSSTHWRVKYLVGGSTTYIALTYFSELEFYESGLIGTNTSDVSTVVAGVVPSGGVTYFKDGYTTTATGWSVTSFTNPSEWYLDYVFTSPKAITQTRWATGYTPNNFPRGFSLYYLDASSEWQLQWNSTYTNSYIGGITFTNYIDVTTHDGLPSA